MPQYMVDTDTVSFALRGHGRVVARILEHRPSALSISSITLAELRFGAEARRSRKLHHLISTFVESVPVVAFDQRAADQFATVAPSLARRGEPIGTFDTLMAAHALSLGLTFVTNNTQHFRRVVGLKTENWVWRRGHRTAGSSGPARSRPLGLSVKRPWCRDAMA